MKAKTILKILGIHRVTLYNYVKNGKIRGTLLPNGTYKDNVYKITEIEMKHQAKYLGKKVKRGLFKSSTNRYINSDVNGAIGILRKVVNESFIIKLLADRDVATTPFRVSL